MGMMNKFNSYKKIIEMIGIYLFLSFAGCVMVLFRAFIIGRFAYIFLIWNLFLTWIPFCLSILIDFVYRYHKKSPAKTLGMLAGGAVWFAFYPNAPYLITDFIHLSGMTFHFTNEASSISFLMWYDFIMISLFILTGFLLGFVSLYLIQKVIADKLNQFAGWAFVACTLFFSSFGIYLGRFIRWNSWDIVTNPIPLMNSIIDSFHKYAVAFTSTFGLFLILIYIALYYLTHLNRQNIRRRTCIALFSMM